MGHRAVLRDEAEALVSVEPLDGALSHDDFLRFVSGLSAPELLKTSMRTDVQRTETRSTRYEPRIVRGQDGWVLRPFNTLDCTARCPIRRLLDSARPAR